MTALLGVEPPAASLTLDHADGDALREVASGLLTVAGGRVDDPAWQAEAGRRSHDLPVSLRRALAGFRRDPGLSGVFLLSGLPVDELSLPATPAVSGSVQRVASVPSAMQALVTHLLGYPVAFRPEKTGALVQDVVPVPGSEEFQGNEGSVLLALHTENAFHDHRPDYVLLLCLRADHDRVASLRTASVRQALAVLAEDVCEALRRNDFITEPPPSFASGPRAVEPLRHAVLSGAPEDPDLVVDFAATTSCSARGTEAMGELQRCLAGQALAHRLVPGDLAIVDNRVTVHGRSAFTPRYDGQDRWLQRTFAVQNLRRSRGYRPDDGYVLA
ncbi:TauD/TfdA family dioxygenase [Kutzneria sp. CA-103260]|uniref:TauD/TfdA family dioxygenase n=1 Tax=Kutzneria sp. CA-103260 TaxID=2802641 RepID=UPI001BA522F5|nr:TauD/TfdA family dioxygenase [Kutzneria sp. CA-103260]QUQ64547.1 oxygenase [Kutzneria sp. CA-103260]